MRGLRMKKLTEKLGGVSTATVYRRVADGTLPPPKKLGQLSIWDEDEVDARLAERLAPREPEAA